MANALLRLECAKRTLLVLREHSSMPEPDSLYATHPVCSLSLPRIRQTYEAIRRTVSPRPLAYAGLLSGIVALTGGESGGKRDVSWSAAARLWIRDSPISNLEVK
jgi:hypothetical protein